MMLCISFCRFDINDCANNLDFEILLDRNKISTLLLQCFAQYNKEFYFLDVDQKSNNLNVLLVTSQSVHVVTGSIIAPHDPIITDKLTSCSATLYSLSALQATNTHNTQLHFVFLWTFQTNP